MCDDAMPKFNRHAYRCQKFPSSHPYSHSTNSGSKTIIVRCNKIILKIHVVTQTDVKVHKSRQIETTFMMGTN
jgi:hypothetical protein